VGLNFGTTPLPPEGTGYRVGLYGGAFDPPHHAHTTLAQAAIRQFALDELIILPTGRAWHKSRQLSDASHRVAMAQLAFEAVPHARVDARETGREGATYTIDTLEELSQERFGQAVGLHTTSSAQAKVKVGVKVQWFVLMGQDQWERFESWQRFRDILSIATILVASRAHTIWAKSTKSIETAPNLPHQTVHMPLMDISATDIRLRAAQRQPIDHLVNPAVARYIAQHRLYQTPE
jgi:nicotinate-nucleotide adenylyltransferase